MKQEDSWSKDNINMSSKECKVRCDHLISPMTNMENIKDSSSLIQPTLGDMKDINLTTKLDKERYQVARLRQEIIDEYQEKSRELLDYLNSMEADFNHQQKKYEQREAILRQENKTLKDHLAQGSKVAKRIRSPKTRNYKREVGHGIESNSLNTFKGETMQYKWSYRMEHNRAQELKAYVDDLQLELQRAKEIALQRKKRMDQSKKRWEIENRELRRKAALGWMLGCLSELYLKIDPKIGGIAIMKLVKKVQHELEGETNIFNDKNLSPKIYYHAIQGELHRLIGSSQASSITSLQDSKEALNVIKEVPFEDIETCNGNYQDELPRRRRKKWQKYRIVLDSGASKAKNSKRPDTSPSIL